MKFRFFLLPVLLTGLLAPTLSAQSTAENPSNSALSKFFAAYFEQRLRDDPEFATNVGRHEYDDRWADVSKKGREERRSHLEQALAGLDKFPFDQLSAQDQLSVKLLRYDLRTRLDSLDLETYLLRVGQMTGFHNNVYLTIDRMPTHTVKECENIIARIRAVPSNVDQNIAIMNEAIERGWTQPKIVADLVIEQLTAQVAQDASNTPLLVFIQKMPSKFLRRKGSACAKREPMPSKTISVRRGASCWRTCRPLIYPRCGRVLGLEVCTEDPRLTRS